MYSFVNGWWLPLVPRFILSLLSPAHCHTGGCFRPQRLPWLYQEDKYRVRCNA